MSFYDDASWLLIPSGIKEDVVFAQKPTSGLGDLTFTRSSDATYTDSTGVVRRSPYNLLTFSEQFNDGSWNKTALTISTSATANPVNGALTAQDAIPTAASSVHRILKLAGAISTANTWSIFAKAKGYNFITIVENGNTSASVSFNLSTGAVSTQISAVGQIQSLGNGWYRCSMVHTTTVSPRFDVYISPTDSITAYTGDGTSGVTLFGAQAVEGTSALDYFPTTNRQDVPRIDFRNADGTLSNCGRLLLEPQRTNSIRNSTMVGAVTGSPGTAPTNWIIVGQSGISSQILATGIESGLQYIDVRITGTAASSGSFRFLFEQNTGIAATNGQTWTASVWARITGVSLTGTFAVTQRNAVGGVLTTLSTPLAYTSTLSRFTFTSTNNNALTAFAIPEITVALTGGTTYDFTIRIAAPQMELGAYATTFIPTTTAAVTRVLDGFTRGNIFTNGLISSAGGTWFIDLANLELGVGYTQAQTLGLGNDVVGATANNIWLQASSPSNRIGVWKQINGSITSLYLGTSTRSKLAIKWDGANLNVFENGVKVVTNSAFTTTQLQTLRTYTLTHPYHINQSALFPVPMTDAQCIQMTTI
jgi:hypothetical protein